MSVGLLPTIAAAGLLWLGAELFVENAASAGHRLGVTGLAVGLLLAGAEPDELNTAVIAALWPSGLKRIANPVSRARAIRTPT